MLDLVTARRWAMTARLMLGAARERIAALNVFPVADGDTGTNMYLTIDGALGYVRGQFELGAGTDRLKDGLTLISRGMLLSARGNSGIILSQLTRGLAEAVDAGVEHAGPADVAAAFEAAARTAWDALASPVEGTILSVARAAAQGARDAVERGHRTAGPRGTPGQGGLDVADVVTEALDAAQDALARTPEQLPVLAASGVVDAGGAGLVLVIEALQSVLHGRPPGAGQDVPDWWVLPPHEAQPEQARPTHLLRDAPRQDRAGLGCLAGDDDASADAAGEHAPGGAVEVMYLLTGSDAERAARLRTNLAQVGSSVAVAGGPEEFRVHVHLDDPRSAVEAGSLAGLVTEVTVTSLADGRVLTDHDHAELENHTEPSAGPGLAVVACALGKGVAELFSRSGAMVVSGGPRRRASAGQLLAAVLASRAPRVVLLPNDSDTAMVAHATAAEARASGVQVDVVPTRSLVEGIAAVSVLDLEGDPDAVVEGMCEAAAAVRPGALTRAERPAQTPAGPCTAGQWLGILGRERIVAVDDDVAPVARALVDLLWTDDVEVVTVLLGESADAGAGVAVAQALAERAAARGSRGEEVEVVTLRGDQPTYPVLLGVE